MGNAFTSLPVPVQAGAWGFLTALSLMIGCGLGLATDPSETFVACAIAFGGGALIYAVSVELYGAQGEKLEYSKTEDWLNHRMWNNVIAFFTSILGAVLYLLVNELVIRCQAARLEADDPNNVVKDGDNDSSFLDQHQQQGNDRRSIGPHGTVGPQGTLGARGTNGLGHRGTNVSSATNAFSIHARRMGLANGSQSFAGHAAPALSQDLTHYGTGRRSRAGSRFTQGSRIRGFTNFDADGGDKPALGATQTGASKLQVKFNAEMAADVVDPRQRADSAETMGSYADVEPLTSEEKAEAYKKALKLATGMWLGLFLDCIPEAIVIGFMVNSGGVPLVFVVAIFIANFPEAYSASALLNAQGIAKIRIFLMWFAVFMTTGTLAWFGSWILPVVTEGDTDQEMFQERAVAIMKGVTGGSMMAMIATAMLPEAFHMVGPSAGLLFVTGFVFSDLLKNTFTFFEWEDDCVDGQPTPTTPRPTPPGFDENDGPGPWWIVLFIAIGLVVSAGLTFGAYKMCAGKGDEDMLDVPQERKSTYMPDIGKTNTGKKAEIVELS